jgi:hypothetical protein
MFFHYFPVRPRLYLTRSFDIELPAECDDEYWDVDDDGHVSFNQPPGKPSRITGFINHVKLTETLAYATRTLYSTKPHVAAHRSREEWEQQIVAEIDSAMNRWKDSLPDHRMPICFACFSLASASFSQMGSSLRGQDDIQAIISAPRTLLSSTDTSASPILAEANIALVPFHHHLR